MNELVLVTGGSGFVGSHCILQLLNAGYRVRTTLRTMSRQAEVIEMMENGDARNIENLSFIAADLTKDDNWDEAMQGCTYVMHVATPLTLENVPEDEIIRPAVDGTLRVLKAAANAGVKRVVLTSSFAAIGYGKQNTNGKPFTEENWTNLNSKNLSSYVKAKTLAEKAAWDFIVTHNGAMELTSVNPMAIFGPLLGADLSTGHQILRQLLDGSMKACPHITLGVVDVRDVADLHLRAMTNPAAKGQRFLALAGGMTSFPEIALLLRARLGDDAKNVTTKTLPDWFIRLAALFSAKARQVAPMLGITRYASNEKARTLLDWSPRTNEEATITAAESLINLGLNRKAS